MVEGTRQPYPSDMSDAQWEQLAPLIPPKVGKGKNRTVNLREVMNAILYVLRTGCQWAYLPRDFPPWKDYERTITSSEATIKLANIALLLRRLEPNKNTKKWV